MKKYILLLVLLFVPSLVGAENFCVDTGDTWNSAACATDCAAEVAAHTCMTISDFATSGNWGSSDTENKIDAGDTVYFADNGGDHVPASPINIAQSGASGQVITLTEYPGDSPVITGRGSISGWDTSENWSDETGNVWSFSLSRRPWRIFLDDSEVPADTSSAVDATNKWYWNDGTDTLYVYATENPSTAYSDIEAGNNISTDWGGMLIINGKDYITIDGLDIRGGCQTVRPDGDTDNLTIQNCNIGKDSGFGIYAQSSGGNSIDNLIIRYNTIDGDYTLGPGLECASAQDGINLKNGVNGALVYQNVITNWHHVGVGIEGSDASYTSNGNKVYNNEIYAEGSNDYMRCFSMIGITDKCNDNEFYNNYCHDLTVRSQIVAPNNKIYNNLFIDTTDSLYTDQGRSQALSIELFGTYDPSGNLVYNNTIINAYNEGIRLTSNGVVGDDVTGNIIKNNIFYNTNTDNSVGAIKVENDSTDTHTNTISNNVFYTSGQATPIWYRGTSYSVANFEANLSDNDVAANNVATDPTLNADGTLIVGSPAIGAGVDLGNGLLYGLDPTSTWPDNVKPVDQDNYGDWEIGAFIYGSAEAWRSEDIK